MAKEQTDDEQNLRRKARRRLIGAIALTLAVVVILPMVLDSEPKPTGQDIDLRIPSPDKVGEFIPGVAVSEVAETLPPAGSAVGVASAPVATSAAVVAPAGKEPVAASTPKAEAPGKAQAVANDGFVAQIGAYSNADTAKQEVDKLKKWGFKAYAEKAGDKIRVRVGPYPDREKAEKVSKLLKKHGLHPVVTNVK